MKDAGVELQCVYCPLPERGVLCAREAWHVPRLHRPGIVSALCSNTLWCSHQKSGTSNFSLCLLPLETFKRDQKSVPPRHGGVNSLSSLFYILCSSTRAQHSLPSPQNAQLSPEASFSFFIRCLPGVSLQLALQESTCAGSF